VYTIICLEKGSLLCLPHSCVHVFLCTVPADAAVAVAHQQGPQTDWQVVTLTRYNDSIIPNGGLAVDTHNKVLYIGDRTNKAVWRQDLVFGQSATVCHSTDDAPARQLCAFQGLRVLRVVHDASPYHGVE